MMAPIRIAHILGFHAQQGKDPAVAVGELLELLRALQDSARGHVTLVSTMIAVASSEIVAARLDAILGSAKLGKAQLEDFAGALDRLIAAVPPFSDTLEGEREAQELYLGVGGLEPPDWSPPGGWMEGMRPQSDATTEHVADPRDEAAALLASVEQSAAARALACPAGATLAACRDGLDKLGAAPAPDHLDVAALWKQGMTDEPGMRMKMRQQIVDILASISQADFHRYVEKVAGSLARLAELRIHVEVLRTHKCDPATLAKLSPAALGAPLDIHADKRELVVGAWTMHCR
jgi:hypothetical protein